MVKCKISEEGFEDYCETMAKAIEPEANASKKGIIKIVFLDVKSDKSIFLGAAYRFSGKKNAQQALFNFCPWCGEKIINEKEIYKNENKK